MQSRVAVRFGVEGTVLAELDGRHLSTEMRSGFVGRIIDWFDYEEVLGDDSRRGCQRAE